MSPKSDKKQFNRSHSKSSSHSKAPAPTLNVECGGCDSFTKLLAQFIMNKEIHNIIGFSDILLLV